MTDATLAIPSVFGTLSPAARDALARRFEGLESPHSRKAYSYDWARWQRFLDARGVGLLAATHVDVVAWDESATKAGRAKPSRSRALSALRRLYDVLLDAQLVAVNPVGRLRVHGHHEATTPWLTTEELAAVLGAFRAPIARSGALAGLPLWPVEHRNRAIVYTLAGLGVRVSTLAGIWIGDLRPGDGGRMLVHLRVLKRDKEADLLLPTVLQREIESWLARLPESGPLFPRESRSSGGLDRVPLGVDGIRGVLTAAATIAGLPVERVTPHALRRTFATILYRQGVPLAEIQEALCHASIDTTRRYLMGAQATRHSHGELLLGDATVMQDF